MSFTPDCTVDYAHMEKCAECELPDGECAFDFCKNCLLMKTIKCPQCGAWMNPNLERCTRCEDEAFEKAVLTDEYLNEVYDENM